MASEANDLPSIPRIVRETEEGPQAPMIFVDGMHAHLLSHNAIKISLFQDLPPLRAAMENGQLVSHPRRRIAAHLVMDLNAFTQLVNNLNGALQNFVNTGQIVIDQHDDQSTPQGPGARSQGQG